MHVNTQMKCKHTANVPFLHLNTTVSVYYSQCIWNYVPLDPADDTLYSFLIGALKYSKSISALCTNLLL